MCPAYLSLPEGVTIRRMSIISDFRGFFSLRRGPAQTEFQRFSISRSGEVRISTEWGSGGSGGRLETVSTRIDPVKAAGIIDGTVRELCADQTILEVRDGLMWDMTLTDTDGKRYTCYGFIDSDPEYVCARISDRIRFELGLIFMNRSDSLIDVKRMTLLGGSDPFLST